MALVEATSVFEMAQRKRISYLLFPTHVAPDFAPLLGDERSSLEHHDWAVRTPDCLEEFHQNVKIILMFGSLASRLCATITLNTTRSRQPPYSAPRM